MCAWVSSYQAQTRHTDNTKDIEYNPDAEERAPQSAPKTISKQLAISDEITDGDKQDQPIGNQGTKHDANQHYRSHERLDEETFFQLVVRMLGRKAEKHPDGKDEE